VRNNFFAELKRRNVYKVAVAYAVVGWLVIQVCATIVPALHMPEGITTAVVVLVLLGFPVALVIAWAFEMTPEGMKRTEDVSHETLSRWSPRKFAALIVTIALIAGGLLVWQLVGTDRRSVRFDADERRRAESLPIGEKSIAVLPFQNLSDDKQNTFFTDGVQDEILSHLARIADLKVISRTSVMHYKSELPRNLREIGQQLGVAHLLEGSVQRAGSKVRVIAQLIDARNDAHLWAQTYDRDLTDVFAIQSEIARAIADQLQAKISPGEKNALERPPTADVAAFDLYSRAKTLLLTTGVNPITVAKNFPQAIDVATQAVARDPSFFRAYCLLAYAHDRLYLGRERTPERLAQAQAALDAATRLQPDAGETHLARAQHLYSGYYDYAGAIAELEIARRNLPNEARIPELLGLIARRQGKWEDSVHDLERSLELDPRSFISLEQIAQNLDEMRRYPEAAAAYDRVLAIYPDDLDAQFDRARIDFRWKVDTTGYRRLVEQLRQKDPAAYQRRTNDVLILALAERDIPLAEAALATQHYTDAFTNANAGQVARLAGNEEKARAFYTAAREEQEKVVQTQPNDGRALAVLARCDAALGRKEEALRNGRRAMEVLPMEKDALYGIRVLTSFAVSASWVGEKDLALEYLARAVQYPAGPSYGELKLDPDWDALHGDPRFEKIVASLAPALGITPPAAK